MCLQVFFFFSVKNAVNHVVLCNIIGEQWHLQRTNWCGEVADVLEDEVRDNVLSDHPH